MKDTEIIDFDKKGNSVRFFLGTNGNQWGDDWNDAPYEHNASSVYSEHVKGHIDLAFEFDALVLEPSDGTMNSEYTKEEMVKREVPCIVVLPAKHVNDDWRWIDDFNSVLASDKSIKFYFGDNAETIAPKMKSIIMQKST